MEKDFRISKRSMRAVYLVHQPRTNFNVKGSFGAVNRQMADALWSINEDACDVGVFSAACPKDQFQEMNRKVIDMAESEGHKVVIQLGALFDVDNGVNSDILLITTYYDEMDENPLITILKSGEILPK